MVLSQALINAAREGDLAAVQEWLDAGGDPDETGSFGGRSRTLLHHVASAHDPTAETPAAFARLIGGGTSRPRTRAAAKKALASPGLPDPLAHLVCKFWLGEPPRRRRAAPATE